MSLKSIAAVDWFEYQVGPNILTLAQPRRTASDPPTPKGAAALQLAPDALLPRSGRQSDRGLRGYP